VCSTLFSYNNCLFTVLFKASSHFLSLSVARVDSDQSVNYLLNLLFFYLSSHLNYRSVIFIVDISTSNLIFPSVVFLVSTANWDLLPYLGCICFSKSGFRKTTSQTFMCLFIIRKVGQRKTLSEQWKTLSSQNLIFPSVVFMVSTTNWDLLPYLGCVCFLKSGFRKTISQTFICLFVIRKVGRRKTLSSQRKI